jgi:hypothetical protein
VVLREPGKPSYTVAKAYCPIALLNVASKILSACIATHLTSLATTHDWLPDHHFGGWAGRTTTDTLHLLTKTVKDAWACSPGGQVASALFLNVKGAFPHTIPAKLASNMKKLGVPKVYIDWMTNKLDGHSTCLSFDDYESEQLPILQGIDQGCPLSVIFYLLYNRNLVLVPRQKSNELCITYIDDITYIAWGKTFKETHETLESMMNRKGGALKWSASHHSAFELDKTGCIDFLWNKSSPART